MVIHVDATSEAMVQAFSEYQRVDRGLAERTVYNAAFIVRHFLAWRAEAGAGGLEELRCEELGDFVVHEARRLKPGGMPTLTSTVRSFARFLFLRGVTARDLSGAVPSVRTSRFGALPSAVDPAVVQKLLAGCDFNNPAGRRDYAILLLMSRLGLRASEIARMCLEDIDWRAGEIEVLGKGKRRDRLPLPSDVGEALVDYLRFGRPASASRDLDLCAVDGENLESSLCSATHSGHRVVSQCGDCLEGIAHVGTGDHLGCHLPHTPGAVPTRSDDRWRRDVIEDVEEAA